MTHDLHSSTGFQPGEVLAGKYRIEGLLGRGGMGMVVAAQHLHLDDRVAIKFLLPEALDNAEAVARFVREARAAVKIKSEHVARVSDVGTLENGAPYMVMEYLDGQDLSKLVRGQGALQIADAVEYVLQASEAIAEAHALGIVHRDLKPSNLFLVHRADGSPSIKVLDFGISKVGVLAGSGSDLGMTKTTAVMGSPLYMSPEQMASAKDADARADIWALGVILHEIISGRVPFEAETMPQLCAMVLQQPAPPLRDFRPEVPEGLQQVVLRCLEKQRDRRFSNVADLAVALAPYGPPRSRVSVDRVSRVIQSAGISTTRDSLQPQLGSSPAHSTQAAWGRTGSSTSSSKRLLAFGLAAVMLLGGVLAFALTRDGAKANVGTDTGPSAAAAAPGPAKAALPNLAADADSGVARASAGSAPVASASGLSTAPAPPPPADANRRAPTVRKPRSLPAAPAPRAGTEAPKPATDLYSDRK